MTVKSERFYCSFRDISSIPCRNRSFVFSVNEMVDRWCSIIKSLRSFNMLRPCSRVSWSVLYSFCRFESFVLFIVYLHVKWRQRTWFENDDQWWHHSFNNTTGTEIRWALFKIQNSKPQIWTLKNFIYQQWSFVICYCNLNLKFLR